MGLSEIRVSTWCVVAINQNVSLFVIIISIGSAQQTHKHQMQRNIETESKAPQLDSDKQQYSKCVFNRIVCQAKTMT